MNPTWQSDGVQLYHGDALDILSTFTPNSCGSSITDPPYGSDAEFFPHLLRVSTGNIVVFCKPENQFFKPDEYLFWIKTPSTKNFTKSCGRFVEMILVKRRPGAPFNNLHWSQMIGVYDDRHIYQVVHPFEKPLSLIERLVRIYTNIGDVILDPFMGSGTVGVVAVREGRKFIGIERDPTFFEIAKLRIQGGLLGAT